MLGQDCLESLRKISKALSKVNLEDKAMVGNEMQWNINFLKKTKQNKKQKKPKQLQVGKTLILIQNFHHVLH